MNDHRLPRQLGVVAGPKPRFQRVEIRRRTTNGNHDQLEVFSLRKRQALECQSVAAFSDDNLFVLCDPFQVVPVISDRMLGQAAVGWIDETPAVGPGVAHHVPAVVIRKAIVARRVGQPKSVPHFVRHGGVTVVPIWRLPGGGPNPARSIEGRPSASPPSGTTYRRVEHQIDARKVMEHNIGIRHRCAVRKEAA
jgi:hypothetical protein